VQLISGAPSITSVRKGFDLAQSRSSAIVRSGDVSCLVMMNWGPPYTGGPYFWSGNRLPDLRQAAHAQAVLRKASQAGPPNPRHAARIEALFSRTTVLLEIMIDRRGWPTIVGGLPPM
jgi:hypothetical protein